MNAAKQNIRALVLMAGLAATAQAQLGAPTPVLTTEAGAAFVDPFGATWYAPGTGPIANGTGWPGNTVAGANFWFTATNVDGDPSVFSNAVIVNSSESGPIKFTAVEADQGDFSPNFGIAQPNDPLSYLDDPFYLNTDLNLAAELNGFSLPQDSNGNGEIREASGRISLRTGGLPSYGWKPDAAQGVMLVQPITNGVVEGTASQGGGNGGVADPVAYRALVLGTSSLQNYWTFEDATGTGGTLTTVEDVAGTDDGVVIGTVTTEAGLVGNTGVFPGDTDNETINNVVSITGSDTSGRFDLQGNFTVEALVKFNMIPERFAAIISKGDDSWRMSPDGDNPFFEPSANGLGGSTTNTSAPFADNEWHHLAFVVDSTNGVQRAYLDGVAASSAFTAGSSVDISLAEVMIGGNAQKPEREWLGAIDEVAIYTDALSEQQILDRVNALALFNEVEPQTIYTVANVVVNSADRTGPGYSMVNGLWGDSNNKLNSMRVQISAWGSLGEAVLPVGLAWFPYEQGFLGGYHTPKGLEYRNPPIFADDTAENTGAITDPAEVADLFVLPAQETIGGKTIQWLQAQSTGVTQILGVTNETYTTDLGLPDLGITSDFALFIEGSVDVAFTDTYFFGVEADDAALVDVFVDGAWTTVAGRRNTGGAAFFDGEIDLDPGTYPVRVRYIQRGGGGTLSLYLDDSFTFQEPMVFAGSGADVSLYDLDLLDTRNDTRYVGLVDTNNDGDADYGLGSWRTEHLSRVSASRELAGSPDMVKYLPDSEENGENGLHGRVRFDFPGGQSPANGMLFVQGTESSSQPVWAGLLPPAQTGTGWEAQFRRSRSGDQVDNSSGMVEPRQGAGSIASTGNTPLGFLYVPYNADGLIGGYVLGDGSASAGPVNAQGTTVTRTGEGSYELTIPGKTGADGVLVFMPVGLNDLGDGFATRANISYEYNSGTGSFEVESRVWNPGGDGNGGYDATENTYPLTDSGFYFMWVDFTSPFSMPEGVDCVVDVTTDGTNPGDAAYGVADGSVTVSDLTYFVEFWLAGDLGVADVTTDGSNPGDADYGVSDGTVSVSDLTYFVELWIAGCP